MFKILLNRFLRSQVTAATPLRGGVLPIMTHTGRHRPKGYHFQASGVSKGGDFTSWGLAESLFTRFASLTYAYRYLMTLIKEKLWILKGHNSFIYLWKFEPNKRNGFREILFQKFEILQRNVWLINFFATQQFRNFWWLIFPSILLAKSWKLHKLLNLINFFNFCI